MKRSDKDTAKIEAMFSSIASRYDLLNRLLSMGRDSYWRKYAVNQLPDIDNGTFLDIATGTGDIAIEIAKRCPPGINVKGVDLSEKMIELGKEKVINEGFRERIELGTGDINSLDFKDNYFDAAIIAFGIRNIQDYKQGIKEMARVVKDGGKIIILEFTSQQNPIFKWPYRFYITRVLPFISSLISGKKSAYRYLSDSVIDFPPPEELKNIMEEAGLKEVKYQSLTLGITTVHTGIKC
jgi:demethylmenaquinone methyltransferase/2-methoxy-6-polyprenyl-1,4-benzoquinol methylase